MSIIDDIKDTQFCDARCEKSNEIMKIKSTISYDNDIYRKFPTSHRCYDEYDNIHRIPNHLTIVFETLRQNLTPERFDVVMEIFTWIELFNGYDDEGSHPITTTDSRDYAIDVMENAKTLIISNFDNYGYDYYASKYIRDRARTDRVLDLFDYLYSREVTYLLKEIYRIPTVSFMVEMFQTGNLEDMIYYFYNCDSIVMFLDESDYLIYRELRFLEGEIKCRT